MLGLGAMIHSLSGGSSHSSSEYHGRKIAAAELSDNRLRLTFEDGVKISVFDDGQSCCENRYITTDDAVSSLVGHSLTGISSKDGPETVDEWEGTHETCFVEIATDGGSVTLTTHVEHNGYYGGFGLSIVEED